MFVTDSRALSVVIPESFSDPDCASRRTFFCTFVHIFAQIFSTNLIDAEFCALYLARQIEPEA
jgi:hypothetical protein